MTESKTISKQALQRLPLYLNYLRTLPKDRPVNISATAIAEALHLNDVQVRKDLAVVSAGGRPKVGYITEELILEIEQFLGYNDVDSAVLVGVGKLGSALLAYDGFSEYGLHIVAGFDIDERIAGGSVEGRKVLAMHKLPDICRRMNIKIGIIAVPASQTQSVCDVLIENGILAIWNFAPVHLNTPETVVVKSENMACSLAVLSKHLIEKIYENKRFAEMQSITSKGRLVLYEDHGLHWEFLPPKGRKADCRRAASADHPI